MPDINPIMESAIIRVSEKKGYASVAMLRNEIAKSSPVKDRFDAKHWAWKMIQESFEDGFIKIEKINIPSSGNRRRECVRIVHDKEEQLRVWKMFEFLRINRKK